MITIPDCATFEIETIFRVPHINPWLKDMHATYMEVLYAMVTPGANDPINQVQRISMAIARRAGRLKYPTDEGEIVNATWSDQYFSIILPTMTSSFDTIRIERSRHGLHCHITMDEPLRVMSVLGFGPIKDKLMGFMGLNMSIKEAAFLMYCDYMKPGMSAPFRDMLEDGEL